MPDFQSIVDEYYAALYRFALSLVKEEADAADLTQQTFYIWAEKGHQLREAGKVKSWLFTTLYREFLGGKRKQSRHPQVDLDDIPENLQSEESQARDMVDSQSVVEALDDMEETYRSPLVLFYLKQHSYKEIAHILDVPIGTVMSRLSRGTSHLRKLLSDPNLRVGRKKRPESGKTTDTGEERSPSNIIPFEDQQDRKDQSHG